MDDRYILGVDECGIGAIAGPAVVGAALIPEDAVVENLRDSKSMTPNKREEVFKTILDRKDIIWATVWASSQTVDELGIWKCWSQLVRRAISCVYVHSLAKKTRIIVDGDKPIEIQDRLILGAPAKRIEYITKSEDKFQAVAAAALVAKVSRDKHMRQLSEIVGKQYCLHTTAGYPKPKHLEALRTYGVTPFHRKSYRPVREQADREQVELGQVEAE